MSNYLNENKSTSLSKLIFSIRSGTLDIKCLNKWNYGDNLCVMCELKAETLENLMICPEYGENEENSWREIYGNNPKKQIGMHCTIMHCNALYQTTQQLTFVVWRHFSRMITPALMRLNSWWEGMRL